MSYQIQGAITGTKWLTKPPVMYNEPQPAVSDLSDWASRITEAEIFYLDKPEADLLTSSASLRLSSQLRENESASLGRQMLSTNGDTLYIYQDEESLFEPMVEYDIVVRMSPIEEQSIEIIVESVEEARLRVVEPEN
jgi:hypothetical protein